MTVLVYADKRLGRLPEYMGGRLVAADPGNNGALLAWNNPRKHDLSIPDWTFSVSGGVVGVSRLRKDVALVGDIHTLIVEGQFVGKGARSALRVAMSSGIVIGSAMAVVQINRIVIVAPSMWQRALPSVGGPRKGRGKRAAVRHVSNMLGDEGETWLRGPAQRTKANRQGILDAWCMGYWLMTNGVGK